MDSFSFQVQWSDADKAYVATSPEFPGVSAVAPTAEEALAEARIALQAAVETYDEEGWQLPTPLRSAQHSGQFRLRVPHSLHSALVARAAAEGVSLNTLAVTYLATGIGAAGAQSLLAEQCERALQDIRGLSGALAVGLANALPSFVADASWEPAEFNTKWTLTTATPPELPARAFVSGTRMAAEDRRPHSARMPLSKVLAA